MVVCLSVKTGSSETVFEYLGSDADLWKTAVQRVLTDPIIKKPTAQISFENSEYFVTAKEVHRLRDRVRLPGYFIEIEKVVQQVSSGQWDQLVLPREHFKVSVRKVWSMVKKDLVLEGQVLDCLTVDGNGGLRVESILSRLLAAGVVARFGAVRDALGHLCKLYLVERAYGQFSIREGMLKR